MEVDINLDKSIEENASSYFEQSKKAKRKLAGLMKAIGETERKARGLEEKQVKEKKLARKRKKHWFQAFRWFKTSQGFLVIAGRDARSNETAVKKHLREGDIFLHADIQGGSACIVKGEGKKIPKEALQEAAMFAAAWSKAWQQGLASVDVYAAAGGQVSKKAPSGEALGTGAFMVYGKRQWFRKTPLQFAVGLLQENGSFSVMAAPPSAVKKHCIAAFRVSQGKQKKSDAAKQLLAKFEQKTGQKQPVSLDEVIAALPGEQLSVGEQF